MLKVGDQSPLMPFNEIVGKGDKVVPEHIGAIALKVGVILGFTATVILVEVAH